MGRLSKPEWAEGVIWLLIQPELKALPSAEVKFYGRGKRGYCNLTCSDYQLPQRTYIDVPLKQGIWTTALNLACQARLSELPERQPETGWVTLDGAMITIAVRFKDEALVIAV